MDKLILIKYGELTTKKDNRKMFLKQLKINIENKLKNYSYELKYDYTRMFISNFDNNKLDEVLNILKNIFGIYSIVIAYKVNNNIDDYNNFILTYLKDFKTFKIETKRSNKNFHLNSIEINKLVGSYILSNNFNIMVDVHNPEVIVTIEIRNDYTYIYTKDIKGLGGYPVSTLGKGLLMVSGGIDSPVAGYLAMKRGIQLEAIYFASPPHTSIEATNKVKKILKILTTYQSNIKLHIVSFTKIQEEIYKKCDHTYIITILRRMMYRISEKQAIKQKNKIIINGESLGQVASQTLSSIACINEVISIPVIRPVACLDKLEIIDISKKINTYPVSILPYEDCCTIFVPPHPIINPIKEKCVQLEQNLNFEELIEECINSIDTIIIKDNDINNYDNLF